LQGSNTLNIGSGTGTFCTTWTSSRIVCTVPAGSGATNAIKVTVGGQVSNTGITFAYSPPTISSITPTSGGTGGAYIMTVAGTNFGSGSYATFGGVSATLTVNAAHSQGTLTVPAGSGTGIAVVVICGSQSSNSATFAYSPPTISAVTPTLSTATTTAITLTGTNYATSGLAVTVGGAGCASPTATSTTQVTCTAPAGTFSTTTPLAVVVTLSGQTSNSFSLALTAPTVTSLSPSSGSSSGFVITVNGANFGLNTQIVSVAVGQSSGSTTPCALGTLGHAQLLCTVPALATSAGTGLFVFVTVGGAQAKSTATFSYNPPAITAITAAANSFLTDGTSIITITGSGFGSSVSIGSAALTSGGGAVSAFSLVQTWSQTSVIAQLPAGSGASNKVTITAGGQTSAQFTLAYTPPAVTAISPASGNFGGVLIISGSNFFTSGAVFIGSLSVTTSSWSHTSITGTVPNGALTNQTVVVSTGGQNSSSAVLFNFLPISVSAVSPVSGPTAGGTLVTIEGTNWGSGSPSVKINGNTCVVASFTSSQVVCTTPAGQGASLALVVTSFAGQSTTASAVWSYSAPVISSVAPTTINTDGTSLVTLVGTNFGTAPVVTINSKSCPAASASHTQVVCTAGSGQGTSVGVSLSAGNQAASTTMSYTAPSVMSLSPASVNSDTLQTRVTIAGTNFGTDHTQITVRVGGNTVTKVSQLSPLVFFAPIGTTQTVSVDIAVAGQSSNTATLTYNDPVITAVSPLLGAPTGGSELTIAGTSFFTSAVATVTVGGSSCPTLSNSGSQIVCTLPVGATTAASVLVSVGSRSSNSFAYTYATPSIVSFFMDGVAGTPLLSTAGGESLTITGINFASYPTVTLGTSQLTVTRYNTTALVVVTPLGNGANNTLAVTWGGIRSGCSTASACLISYKVPVITALFPTTGVTDGSFALTLTGSNFGATIGFVLIGSLPCYVSGSGTSWSHTRVVCTMSAGIGSSLVPTITEAAQSNDAATTAVRFSFVAPTISSVSVAADASGVTAPHTNGGQTLTVTGANFGPSGSGNVTVGGKLCSYSTTGLQWSNSLITCMIPAHQGAGVAVAVALTGLTAVNSTISYCAPAVSAVAYASGAAGMATAGGTLVTLTGTDFGDGTGIVLMVGGASATPSSVSYSALVFVAPALPSAATDSSKAAVSLSVAGQAATATAALKNGLAAAYLPPTISAVTGCSGDYTAGGLGIADGCSVGGGTRITITGSNLALDVASVSNVTVGGSACTAVALVAAGTAISCLVPARVTGGFFLPVAVTVSGQTGSANAFSYGGPKLTAGTIKLAGASSGGSSVTLANSGPASIELTGTNLAVGGNLAQVSVAYGVGVAKADRLTSTAGVCVLTAGTDTSLTCTMPQAVGGNLRYQVTYNQQLSLVSEDTLSYVQPALVAASLRMGSAGVPGSSVAGYLQSGDLLFFEASYVGLRSDQLSVQYGTASGGGGLAEPVYSCVNVSLVATSSVAATVSCLTSSGFGNNLVFRLTTLGSGASAASAVSVAPFDYSYPQPPVVSGVQGCTDVSSTATSSCPTGGGNTLTIKGQYFVRPDTTVPMPSVQVSSSYCTNVNYVSDTRLTCTLPGGAGSPVAVIVIQGSRFSQSVSLLSYAAPGMTGIAGCQASTDPSLATVDCPRNASALGTVITITGSNFGSSNALIIVGGSQCANTQHDAATPQAKITCLLPSGTSASSAVLLVQSGGVISASPLYLGYEQCAAGKYAASNVIACTACSVGTFSQVAGVIACTACPNGWVQRVCVCVCVYVCELVCGA
jgi:hypothetical protein